MGVAAQLMRGPYPFRGSPPGTGAKGRNLDLLDALIRDAVAGARLPVAFPEPPKLPPGPLGPAELAAAAAAAAALAVATGEAISQVWGWLNSRPEGSSRQGDEIRDIEWSAPDNTGAPMVAVITLYQDISDRDCATGLGGGGGMNPTTQQINVGNASRVVLRNAGIVSKTWSCGGGPVTIKVGAQVLEAYPPVGPPNSWGFWPATDATIPANHEGRWLQGVTLDALLRNGQPVELPGAVPSGFVVPQTEPEAEPKRPLAPPLAPPSPPLAPPSPRPADPAVVPGAPVPGTPAPQPPGTPPPAPAIPRPVRPGEWQPGGPGTPFQPVPPGFPAPTISPSRTPSPLPVRPPAVPDAQPTTPGGQVVTRPQPRPPVTRPGSEVINGIVIPNRPPAPTLQGIAAEVGRIEQKLAYQLRNPEDGTQDLATKLQEVLDALQNQQDAGVYELGGPCERDAEGQPIPFDDTKVQFDWGGKTSALANIASRIDALAELLQYHKLLKQPSCKNPQPTGEWVTVNFRQTDFEAP